MYPGWLPLLVGQSIPEGSRNPVVCVTAVLIVIYVHDLLKIVGNSV